MGPVSGKRNSGVKRYGNPANRRPVVGDLLARASGPGLADPVSLDGAVMLDACAVATVDAVRGGDVAGQAVLMTLGGRVNQRAERAEVGFLFPPDGAAAVVTELLSLAGRHGGELLADLTRRLTVLGRERGGDLAVLQAAVQAAAAAVAGGGGHAEPITDDRFAEGESVTVEQCTPGTGAADDAAGAGRVVEAEVAVTGRATMRTVDLEDEL